jgi:hypothetical protein
VRHRASNPYTRKLSVAAETKGVTLATGNSAIDLKVVRHLK